MSSGAAAVLVGPLGLGFRSRRRSVLCRCQSQAGMPETSAGPASDAGRNIVTRGALQVALQIQLCNCQRTFLRLELHVASSHESPHPSKRSQSIKVCTYDILCA